MFASLVFKQHQNSTQCNKEIQQQQNSQIRLDN